MLVTSDELFEARFPVSCEQFYPSYRERLVVNVGRVVMCGESLDALANQPESFIERHSVEQKPSQPQVISMTEQ